MAQINVGSRNKFFSSKNATYFVPLKSQIIAFLSTDLSTDIFLACLKILALLQYEKSMLILQINLSVPLNLLSNLTLKYSQYT